MPVIGFLAPCRAARTKPPSRRGLAEEGYVEGKTSHRKRFTNFRPELMKEAAGDLVRLESETSYSHQNPEAVARGQER